MSFYMYRFQRNTFFFSTSSTTLISFTGLILYRLQCSAARPHCNSDSSSNVEPGVQLLPTAVLCRGLQTALSRLRASYHPAPRHHTWPGDARCVGKTDPRRPVKCGSSDTASSRRITPRTRDACSLCELMDIVIHMCSTILILYLFASVND